MNIYETNKKTKTENEIKYLIVQSLNNFTQLSHIENHKFPI